MIIVVLDLLLKGFYALMNSAFESWSCISELTVVFTLHKMWSRCQ